MGGVSVDPQIGGHVTDQPWRELDPGDLQNNDVTDQGGVATGDLARHESDQPETRNGPRFRISQTIPVSEAFRYHFNRKRRWGAGF